MENWKWGKRLRGERRRGSKKKILIFLALCIGVCITGGWIWMLRSKGEKGVVIHPQKEYFEGTIIGYSQTDPEWAEDRLGNFSYTMSKSGCLTSCIASALSSQQAVSGVGRKVTAGEFNRFLGEAGVYNQQGDIVWGRLEEAMPETVVRVASSVKPAEIEQLLAKGHYPIVKVKVGGHGAFHWVLLVGSRDGEYICMDPLTKNGEVISLNTHKNKVYRMRCVYWNK
ncbi:hypothetical protein VSQ48_11535 [Candidatus Ventrimonas sp. KK005]